MQKLAIVILLSTYAGVVCGFAVSAPLANTVERDAGKISSTLPIRTKVPIQFNDEARRTLLIHTLAVASMLMTPTKAAVASMVMVSTAEFMTIVRDSARSIQRVELSGPLGETVRVYLADGTVFGIQDVVESPTDPRSPFKIAAVCRENKVPARFVDLEAALATTPKRTKVYSNQRVLEAAEKEKEKEARMQKDEEERRAALYKMEVSDLATVRPALVD